MVELLLVIDRLCKILSMENITLKNNHMERGADYGIL